MTGTLTLVFIVVALVCVVAGVTALARTRRATQADSDEYGESTYAEEAAAVAAAQAAGEAAAARDEDEPEAEPGGPPA